MVALSSASAWSISPALLILILRFYKIIYHIHPIDLQKLSNLSFKLDNGRLLIWLVKTYYKMCFKPLVWGQKAWLWSGLSRHHLLAGSSGSASWKPGGQDTCFQIRAGDQYSSACRTSQSSKFFLWILEYWLSPDIGRTYSALGSYSAQILMNSSRWWAPRMELSLVR